MLMLMLTICARTKALSVQDNSSEAAGVGEDRVQDNLLDVLGLAHTQMKVVTTSSSAEWQHPRC